MKFKNCRKCGHYMNPKYHKTIYGCPTLKLGPHLHWYCPRCGYDETE